MIKSMGLAWITVSDINQSKEFFGKILGLSLEQDSSEQGWMEFAAEDKLFRLGVACQDSSTPIIKAGQNAVVTFTVQDIVQAKTLLVAQKVTLLGDIVEIPGHVKMLMFCDFDKNLFQVVQILS